jgi:hypothetical protein
MSLTGLSRFIISSLFAWYWNFSVAFGTVISSQIFGQNLSVSFFMSCTILSSQSIIISCHCSYFFQTWIISWSFYLVMYEVLLDLSFSVMSS